MKFTIFISISLLLVSAASAQQSTEPRGKEYPFPFAVGVSPKDREAFEKLAREGNEFLKDGAYGLAAAKFRGALEACQCDHPGAHLNWGLSLKNMNQPEEMHRHFLAALRYGPEPIGQDRYESVKDYLAILEQTLTKVHIRCDVPGAKVDMDGRELFTGPGEYDDYVRLGAHTIIASKEGFRTNELRKEMKGGETLNFDFQLNTEEEMTIYTRRWSPLVPYSFLGAGLAASLIGGGFQYAGIRSAHDYDKRVGNCSSCVPNTGMADQRSSAASLQRKAIPFYIVGGSCLAASAILIYLNRPIATRLSYQPEVSKEQSTPISLTPLIDGNSRGFALTGNF